MPLPTRVASATSAAILVLLASLLAGCEKSAPDEIAAAEKAIATKDDKSAFIHLKNAAAAEPNNAKARFLLGQQYNAANEPLSAVAEFKRALELKYPADELARPLADALLVTGQGAQVLALVSPMAVKDPKVEARVQAAIAWANLGLKSLPAARQAVDKAEKTIGPTPETRMIRARLADAEGNAQQALTLVDSLVKDEPNHDNAWTFKGQLQERLPGGSKAAFEAFAKALSVNPKNFIALTSTVGIHVLNKDYKAAHEGLEAMRKLSPKAFMTYYQDAQLKFLEGQYAAARSQFQAALNLVPSSAMALLGSGVNELQLKSYALAENQLARVVQLEPSNPIARFHLARAYIAQGKPDQATTTLAPLVDTQTPLPEPLLLAAQARLLQGDPKGAEQLFGRAAKLHKDNSSVRLALAIMNAAKGNTDAAVQELEQIAASSDGTEADMQLISTHVARTDFPAALAAIQALERKQPASPAADDLRGQVLLKLGKQAEARQAFEAALKKEPLYISSVANLAELDVLDGHPERAQARLEAQVKLDPTNAGIHLGLANLAQRTGKSPQDVVAELEKATRADPRDVRPRLLLIERHLNEGSVDKALDAARGAVAVVPDNAQLLEALARSLLRSGDTRQALATYVKLIQVAPKEPAGYLGQANVLLSMNDGTGADKVLQQLLDLAPTNVEAGRLMVTAALVQKLPDKALTIARGLQRSAPASPLGFALEGEVHMDQKRWDPAAAAFRAATAKPEGESFVARQYEALVNGNKTDEAKRVAADSVKQHPKNPQLLRQLGGVAYNSGDRAQAKAYYEQVLELAPKDVAVLNNLAWILVEAKDPKALAIAQRAVALAPDHPDVLDTLARAYTLNSDNAKAIEALRRAIQHSAAPSNLRLQLARAYVAAGERENARAELETLRNLGRSFPEQSEVRQLMSQIR